MTAATAFLPFSSSARTTRPEQFTRTSVSVPSTIAGSTMRKRMTVPTSSAALVWNSTPPAEMSAVSAKCSRASFVRMVRGSLSGNRTELREWFTHAPLASSVLAVLYTPAEMAQRLLWYFHAPKGHALRTDELKLGYLSKVEAAHLHRRDHHIESFFAARANGFSHGFNMIQRVDQALVEAEIADSLLHFPVFHQERAIAGHAGEDLLIGIDLTDVPQPRDQDALLRSRDHLLHRLFAALGDKDDVGWRFTHFVGQ